jgi:IclR family transcriptional regulator, acetate operon repressor
MSAMRTKEKSPLERTGSSAERALRILALLAAEGRAMSLAELSLRIELPKATVHRICQQLVDTGHMLRDTDEKSFVLGRALRQLALDTLNHDTVRGMRHTVLDALVRDIGETCNFTTLDGAQVLYLDRVEARWPLRLTLDVGAHVPLHCTASGKLFLAHLSLEIRERMLAKITLEALTPNTITRIGQLRDECETIAARGYSTDNEEFIAGLVALAVPVFGKQNEVRAAIAVHAPSARMPLTQIVAQLPALRSAAHNMADLL